ncbi:hypothetical protein ACO0LM_19220 [Undibacterium sp. Di26W]|uniref:hypothetical protein n=1 Tax=Undibacterium sp. Di26W TaxID=3413035 RepID=UPI003BF38937
MKIYGYKNTELPPEEIIPDELAEITLLASVEELRKIASFMLSAANEIESKGSKWEHRHLSDFDKRFNESPHFVIYNPNTDS